MDRANGLCMMINVLINEQNGRYEYDLQDTLRAT